ncbi:MAG: CRTAC1 family protein [Candidatus Solibacter usitatus]|nr:CRTAC1 family protein [Candidatus Solibacter usitatus]
MLALLAGCQRRVEAPAPQARFRDVAAETGLDFRHFPGAGGQFYMPEIMGAGVALFDYDNDGDLDVFLVQGMPLDGSAAPAGVLLGNRLFRNELVPSGQLQFTDVTAEAGLGHIGCGMGAATGDYDNDGYVDLYVTNFGRNVLYHNNGNGTFTDVTAKAGVEVNRWSTSAAFIDYDRDGDLDLFVLNYVDFTVKGNKKCYAPTGEPDYCTPKAYQPVSARLFRNDGGGRFTDVTAASGIGAAYGPGLGVTGVDVNQDGWIDLYVANDTAANLLWINQKNGTFAEQGLALGAAYSEDGLAKAGMGVAAGDFDNDGREDLFVVNLTREGATLFRHEGTAGFQDLSLRLGLRPLTFLYTGFGAGWIDYDNDGWLDLFIANGAVTRMESLRGTPYPYHQRNLLLRNDRARKFTDVSGSAGPALQLSEVSRGAAFGDIDNDGGVDIVVSNNNGPVRLLLNETSARQAWLEVKLEGTRANHQGLGARVGVLRKGAPALWRRVHADSSYLSASDPRVHFGLGAAAAVEAVEVGWPDGSRERFPPPTAGNLVTLRQGRGAPAGDPRPTRP